MRKTETYIITSEGRDKGKHFKLTEMPAVIAERWALRAVLALAHSGVEISEDARSAGMAALAVAGLKSLEKLSFEEVTPILDEMWMCVQILPDPGNPNIIRSLVMHGAEGDDIEEISTMWELRQRIFAMHTDFFFKGSR